VNNIIESSKPDIVILIGTETWVNPNIHSVFCIVSLVIIGIVCDQYEEAREKLIHDIILLSGSMHLSLEVLLTVGADEEVSLTETEWIRLLADYIQETERFDL
jgi:hypothetical protein